MQEKRDYMRNFINYLLTITLFIVIIITITVFTINNLTSKDSTRAILDNIDYNIVINNIKETDYGTELYNYANEYGINKSTVDELLKTDEAKDYSNEVIQQGIDAYLNGTSIKINNETEEFINKINKKYELNLDDNAKEELKNYANDTINNNFNVVINNNNDNTDTKSNESQLLIDIIKTCRNNNLQNNLYITIGIITLLLFISSFKKKNFLEYIGIVSITVAISTLLFNGLLSLIGDKMTATVNASIILKPIISTFYTISLVGITLGIILLAIQHFINKKINKEVIPF